MLTSISPRPLRLALALAAALTIAACSKADQTAGTDFGAAGGRGGAPGSTQDFAVNVGDRVFFESDSTDLTPTAVSTLDKQAAWLSRYPRYSLLVEGHAPVRAPRQAGGGPAPLPAPPLPGRGPRRRARPPRVQLLARRPPLAGGARLPLLARHRRLSHPHRLLRQGASGRDLQRHLMLVAEPPRRDRARRRGGDVRAARSSGRATPTPLMLDGGAWGGRPYEQAPSFRRGGVFR